MGKKGKLVLTTPRLILKDYSISDAPALLKIVGNPDIDIINSIPGCKFPLNIDHTKSWMSYCEEEQRQSPREGYQLGIRLKSSGILSQPKLMGSADIYSIKREEGTADLGYWLGEEYRKEGFMQEALQGLILFAFSPYGLKLRRLEACCRTENTASNNLLKKLGFQEEGLKRKATKVITTGEIYDSYLFGLLAEEFHPILA